MAACVNKDYNVYNNLIFLAKKNMKLRQKKF